MSEIALNLGLWPRQLQAMESLATEMLFGGASEGGKSHFARVKLIWACLMVKDFQGVLVRKKFDDILKNHLYGPTGFNALLKPLIDLGQVVCTQKGINFLLTRSQIAFQHCQDERQFDSAQGVEKHGLVVEEAPQISERLLRFFRGWVRMTPEFKLTIPAAHRDKFPFILYTGNPIGVSVGFFKRHFVKARAPFAMEKVEGFIRQYIPSRAQDNKSVDMEAHRGRLAGFNDAALARALAEGDWDSPVGDFFPEYDDARHAVPDFDPPAHWFRFRSFDWGTAEPFACYWLAVSDGESFRDGLGNLRWFPRGALVAYREYYGCNPDKPADGTRPRNEDIAFGILARSLDSSERNIGTVTDSLPFQDRGGETIAQTFLKCGVPLTLGDTSRIPGWSQLRSRLIGKFIDSNDAKKTPMIYVTESCRYARDYLPALPRHPMEHKREDAAEHGEATHACDALRLACMARPMTVDAPPKAESRQSLNGEMTIDQAMQLLKRNKRIGNGARW